MSKHTEQAREQADLDLANKHIAEAEKRLLQQRARVMELSRDGHDTRQAEELLRVFGESLKTMEAHRAQIVQELERLKQVKTR
jgi:hypothetical protein